MLLSSHGRGFNHFERQHCAQAKDCAEPRSCYDLYKVDRPMKSLPSRLAGDSICVKLANDELIARQPAMEELGIHSTAVDGISSHPK